jgi:hypothetical protein
VVAVVAAIVVVVVIVVAVLVAVFAVFVVLRPQISLLLPQLLSHLFRLFPGPLGDRTESLGDAALHSLATLGATEPLLPEVVALSCALKGGLSVSAGPAAAAAAGAAASATGDDGSGSGGGAINLAVVGVAAGGVLSSSLSSSAAAAAAADAVGVPATRSALRRRFLDLLGKLAGGSSSSSSATNPGSVVSVSFSPALLSPQNLYYLSVCVGLTTALLDGAAQDRAPELRDPRAAGLVFLAATQCFRCIAAAAAHEVRKGFAWRVRTSEQYKVNRRTAFCMHAIPSWRETSRAPQPTPCLRLPTGRAATTTGEAQHQPPAAQPHKQRHGQRVHTGESFIVAWSSRCAVPTPLV